MTTYAQKLKHPMWQRKRLKILNRDNWACRACRDTKNTLHVHHLRYVASRDPWDYLDAELITLCENCHSSEHEEKRNAEEFLISSFRSLGATSNDLYQLSSAIDFSRPDHQLSRNELTLLGDCIQAFLRTLTDG